MNKFILCLLTLMTAGIAVQPALQAGFMQPVVVEDTEPERNLVEVGETVKDSCLTAGLLSGIVACGAFALKKLISMKRVETLPRAFRKSLFVAACFAGMNIFTSMMPQKNKTSIMTLIRNKEILAGEIQILAGLGLLFCGYPKVPRIWNGRGGATVCSGLLGVGLVAAGITQTFKGAERLYKTVIKKK